MASTDLSGILVLVVEDDQDARDLLETVLLQRGARVMLAASAAEGIAALSKELPDVIVSDIAMPDEDGVAMMRRLRALPASAGGAVPAIAVSAFVGAADRARALAAGFNRYLHKPVDFDELADAIAACKAP